MFRSNNKFSNLTKENVHVHIKKKNERDEITRLQNTLTSMSFFLLDVAFVTVAFRKMLMYAQYIHSQNTLDTVLLIKGVVTVLIALKFTTRYSFVSLVCTFNIAQEEV